MGHQIHPTRPARGLPEHRFRLVTPQAKTYPLCPGGSSIRQIHHKKYARAGCSRWAIARKADQLEVELKTERSRRAGRVAKASGIEICGPGIQTTARAIATVRCACNVVEIEKGRRRRPFCWRVHRQTTGKRVAFRR